MGKISVANKKKEVNDVIGLIKPEIDTSTLEGEDSQSQPSQNSPTPKNPLPKSKSGCCRQLFIFGLGVFVFLVLFLSFACLVDYQQGNLGYHISLLPREVREFPFNAQKSVADVLYETPKEIQLVFDGVVKSVNGLMNSTYGKPTVEVNDVMGVETFFKIDVPQEDDNSVEMKTNVEDNDVFGVVGFFQNIFDDIASVFNANNEKVGDTADVHFIVNTNELPRSTLEGQSEERYPMTQSGIFKSEAQVEDSYIFDQTTDSKEGWDIDIPVEAIDEVFDDANEKNHQEDKRIEDKFRSLLPNQNPNHFHEK